MTLTQDIPSFCGTGAGKAFERVCLEVVPFAEENGWGTFGRYGVQASFMKGRTDFDFAMVATTIVDLPSALKALGDAFRAGKAAADTWQPNQSLPDFEGVSDSRQIIFDAKVITDSSLRLDKYYEARGNQKRQLNHMLHRAEFGATCFFLIHWNERKLRTKHELPMTFAYPIFVEHPTWEAFDRGEQKSITRADCDMYAARVCWNTNGTRGTKLRPDIFAAVKRLREMRTESAL